MNDDILARIDRDLADCDASTLAPLQPSPQPEEVLTFLERCDIQLEPWQAEVARRMYERGPDGNWLFPALRPAPDAASTPEATPEGHHTGDPARDPQRPGWLARTIDRVLGGRP